MNLQSDRPDPHNQDEVVARIEWLAAAAGSELWNHWLTAGHQADQRVIDFLRHIATTCRRTANYLERKAVLDQMVADAEEDDLYTRTDGTVPRTR